ncbi:MAG: BON domain-containing protein [Acidobacteria bacterium]|nr:BON domain-containing protein [Acidobacteriota bacterium]
MRILTLVLLLTFVTAAFAFTSEVSDNQIYDQVIRKLANDPDVKGGAFQVDVKDGVVTIEGVVEKEKWKDKAEHLAKKVKGVKGVVNKLVVKPRSA